MTGIPEKLLIRHAQKALFGVPARHGGVPDVGIATLDSEKKRTFLVSASGNRYIMKVNLPSGSEENSLMKMLNEKTALELLERRAFRWAPRVRHFEKEKDLFDAEVLITDYMPDTGAVFTRPDIKRLAGVLSGLHAIRSSGFTIPFGDARKKIKGNGYDFVCSYAGSLAEDARRLISSVIVRKLGCRIFMREAVSQMNRRLKALKDKFRQTTEFSFLHCHVVRDAERRHVIITKDRDIFLVDWESVCFGEREMEVAVFMYENNRLDASLKKTFAVLMGATCKLCFEKVDIYACLLIFDDLIEDLKSASLRLAMNKGRPHDNSFLGGYRRQVGMLARSFARGHSFYRRRGCEA